MVRAGRERLRHDAPSHGASTRVSLQYADHAFSPLDAQSGAWNLRVNPITRFFFLNYHHHLAHHQNPHVPWLHLGHFIDAGGERPAFWRMYLSMWRGPRLMP